MHVTHLDDRIIATRCVLGPVIPLRGVPESRPCDWRARQRDLSNGIIQQTPGARPSSTRQTFVVGAPGRGGESASVLTMQIEIEYCTA